MCMNLVLAQILDVRAGDDLSDTGFEAFLNLGVYQGVAIFACIFVGSLAGLAAQHRIVGRWKVMLLEGILRQDIGWYDLQQPQELAGRMGEAMVHIEKAFSLATYLGLMPLGMAVAAVVLSFVLEAALAAICVAIAVVLALPAAIVIANTVNSRTRLLAEAYAVASGFSAEVLGAMPTVASLGMEHVAITRYGAALESAPAAGIRMTARLAGSNATVTAFTFYVCGAAALSALSRVTELQESSAFEFSWRTRGGSGGDNGFGGKGLGGNASGDAALAQSSAALCMPRAAT